MVGVDRPKHDLPPAEAGPGKRPLTWSNGPHYWYAPHSHTYRKILRCLEGSITFHIDGKEHVMRAGDELVLEPGTEHAATVGPNGCTCSEEHE